MPTRLLFVGDIHLGRTPRRLVAAGLDGPALSPVEAWRRVVERAVQERYDAVVLAGDVVDEDKDRFEAFGHLERGARTLAEAGVRLLAVAGNHDHIALPRLVERLDTVHLIGAGGRWERVAVDGDTPVDLIGWSFPARHHRDDPLTAEGLDEALAARRGEAVALGVLHGDLDGADGGPYAPVSTHALRRLGLAGWFLGHVHQPGDLTAEVPVGYLGSLVGLDRGEEGPRGPWEVSVAPGGLSVRQVPLGPVHWTSVDVDVSDLDLQGEGGVDVLHGAVVAACQAAASGVPPTADAVGVSVRLHGRTAHGATVRRLAELSPSELRFEVQGTDWVVVHQTDATRPAVDLEALAAQPTPVGRLARLIRDLEAGGQGAIPAPVARALGQVSPRAFDPFELAPPPPDDTTVVVQRARRLLERLQAQHAGETGGAA